MAGGHTAVSLAGSCHCYGLSSYEIRRRQSPSRICGNFVSMGFNLGRLDQFDGSNNRLDLSRATGKGRKALLAWSFFQPTRPTAFDHGSYLPTFRQRTGAAGLRPIAASEMVR